MNKKNLVMGGLALGIIGGTTAYLMMNKKARDKAKDMLEASFEDVSGYFEDKM